MLTAGAVRGGGRLSEASAHTAASGLDSELESDVEGEEDFGRARGARGGGTYSEEWISLQNLDLGGGGGERGRRGPGQPPGDASSSAGALGGLGTAEVREAFEAFDTDGDGQLSAEDLGMFFEALGETLGEGDILTLVRAVDQDQDGRITFEEFCELTALYAQASP